MKGLLSNRAMVVLAALAMPAGLALAAGGQAGGEGPQDNAVATPAQGIASAVTALIVFGIVFAVLAVKVWPVIGGALDERASKIRNEIEAAELARKQAKDALEEYQKSLTQARAEAQRMIEQARSQQATVAAELKAKAEAEVAALRSAAMRDIEAAKRAAVTELYAQSATLATTIAGKILKRQINSGDHQQLIEESLGQLQGMKN